MRKKAELRFQTESVTFIDRHGDIFTLEDLEIYKVLSIFRESKSNSEHGVAVAIEEILASR